jgi:MoaA/NifB/PqqE/SkfB family radical SAM enzyme
MYNSVMEQIDSVHLEITSRCNAKCPMCSRTNNPIILNNQSEITYKQFVKFFPPEFISKLKKFKFCGNYGDPAIAHDLIPIHEYIFEHNPNIQITLSTNGGVRHTDFWHHLGKIYNTSQQSFVEWHIDGLEETNHLYRVGVLWKKLMANAGAFIATGANAKWFYIPFFHNEHQVEEAEALAKDMGFRDFVLKISARFRDFKKGHTYRDEKGTVKKIYPPTADRFNIEHMQHQGELICLHKQRKEIYVDSWGRLFPCCWTASSFNKQNNWLISHDKYAISLHQRDIFEILNDPVFQKWLETMYRNDKSICHQRCTGSQVHVIEADGVKIPQKTLWHYREEIDNG